MRYLYAISAAVMVLVIGCSKNDNPATPNDTGGAATTRFFVNPASGSDANPGTDSAPLKTIAKALSLAKAGQHVELQAGTYDAASGQTYPDTIPDGVVLEAVSAGLAVLVGGGGHTAFVATGNDTTRYLSLTGFNSIVETSSGIHVAMSMNVENTETAFRLSSNAQVIMESSTLKNSGAGYLTDIAQMTVNNSAISGQPPSEFFGLQKASNLILNQTTMSDAQTTGIDLRDVSTATVTGCTISKVSLQGAGGSASIDMSNSSRIVLRSTTVSGAYGPVVLLRDPQTAFTARSCTFAGNGTGSGYPEVWQYGGSVDLDSCYVAGATSSGFELIGGSLTIAHSTLQSFKGAAIDASSGTYLKVRTTSLGYSDEGIYLRGPSGTADLGSSTDPGGNTFTNHTSECLQVGYSGGITVLAVGNTWMPSIQGATADGKYGSGLVTGPVSVASPANYGISTNGGKIQF